MNTDDPFELQRFVAAQQGVIGEAVAELRAGRKRTHWMWFVFPQLAGLGHSAMAQRYAVSGLAEARAYLRHPLLGPRLAECTAATLPHAARGALQVFGSPDDLKFRSAMTLFAQVAEPGSVFHQALDAYFAGQPDARTLVLLGGAAG